VLEILSVGVVVSGPYAIRDSKAERSDKAAQVYSQVLDVYAFERHGGSWGFILLRPYVIFGWLPINSTKKHIQQWCKMNRSGVASAIFLYFLNQKFSLSFTVIPLSFKRAVITAPSIDRASARKSFTQLKSEPEEKPAELDLNLEEMFEM